MPFPLKIVRPPTVNSGYIPYNSIKIEFQLALDTPLGKELVVNINLQAGDGATVLEGSITENLPAAPNKMVKCVVLSQTIDQNRVMSCRGVGQLLATNFYHITFKM